MVRRAEYALGKAIRAGQERGEIRPSSGSDTRVDLDRGDINTQVSPREFATKADLSSNGTGIYALVDDVPPDQFEEALTEARAEDNLSRANVVRKIQGVKSDKLAPADRLNKIGDMADAGHTSDQIAKAVGASDVA